ncbi:acyl-CoA synthetase [Natrarchaeobius sp. A-rgal3]|uniref:acyl-CoA synthetase n=1 Tax=Natrarchaeobius versutus TaxID=1679078 RepID=UPI00350FBC06
MIGYDLSDPARDDDWPTFQWDLPERFNVAETCLDATDEAIALRYVDERGEETALTYDTLREATRSVAAGLADRGVDRGDRVAVCLPQSPELLVSQLAILRLGAVVVPLSMIVGEDHFAHALEHANAARLVVDAERARALSNPALDGALVVDPEPAPGHDGLGGLADLASVAEPSSRLEFPATTPDDPAFVLYTSGTSGAPKGVVHGHRYLIGSLPGYQCWFELFDPEEAAASRVFTPAEWAWAGALFNVVFPTLALSGTVVAHHRRSGFDPVRSLGIFESQAVQCAFLPPTALRRIRDADVAANADLEALEAITCGGERLPPSLAEWAESTLDVVVNEGYGQTEANALVGDCQGAYPVREGAMGKPYPGHDVVLVDESGIPVPDGDLGRIALRTPDPVCFLEYYDDPEATEAAYLDEGLLDTGDLAVRDDDGYLFHRGRADELIVSSGYRISPLEVETALTDHDAVADAIVAGLPDEDRGERVAAAVVTQGAPSVPSTESERESLRADLESLVRERLGAYKVPREFVFLEELPETRTGKADRRRVFDSDRESA